MKLAVIGTTFVDIKGYPLGKYLPQGRNAGKIEQFHGGVSRNIAEDIAALDVSVDFVSLVDKGGIGADVISHLKEKNVGVNFVRATDNGMGTWLAIFEPSGEISANISKRPELMPICDILNEAGDDIFSSSDAILLEIDIDEEIVDLVFKLAHKHNKPVYSVISNITVAMERYDYIMQSDLFVCNRIEAKDFFNCTDDDFSSADRALNTLSSNFKNIDLKKMVVTLDSDGAVFCSKDGESGICPPKKVNVIDTTGAGDSFFAGVCVGLAMKESLKDACIRGNEMAVKVIQSVENVYSRD